MIFIKILIFLLLQSIIKVNCELRKYDLYPQYFIPSEQVEASITKLNPCISSFELARNGKTTYIGLMSLNKKEYIYAEQYKKYNQNENSCDLDDGSIVNSRKFYSDSGEQFMILINGCFKINNFSYDGVLVLMEDNWNTTFLRMGVNHYQQKFNQSNVLVQRTDQRSKTFENCQTANCTDFGKNCTNILEDLETFFKIEIICFLIVLAIIVMVCWSTCMFWYYTE